ncbi:MAG: hypothetical protein EVA89_29535 [Sandaracinaceae bacterium]|nr:MAG: hypothetical protein EVA89_29535 [Sandaracinaceae bacterium]
MRSIARTLLVLVASLLLVILLAEEADAQRRRRRRRRQPPPAAQVEEPPVEETEEPAEDGEEVAPPATPIEGEEMDAPPVEETPPEPSEQPTEAFDPGPAPPDVTPIRADYVSLMDDLVQARMRVHALGAELFRTRITVDLQDRTGDNVTLSRLTVHLDGAPIFRSDGPLEHGAQGQNLFSGALAPGPHVLTLELEQRAREDDAYRYEVRESYRFMVARERLSEVTLILEDGSDMARSFPSGGEGRYDVRTRMRVATRALPAGAPAASGPAPASEE